MAASRMLLVSAVMAAASIAQDQALERVKTESAKQRQLNVSDFFENYDLYRTRFHTVIRDWIETQLPKSKTALETKFSSLPARINGELHREGLISPDNREPQIGFLAHIRALRPPDDSNELAVTVGIDVPCGYDDAVYVYDYSQGPPRRVLQRYGTREHDESIAAVLFSKRDATGRQLILTLRYAVQCGSSWNVLAYDLFRLTAGANEAVPIFSGEHHIWFGAEYPYQVRLEPGDLLMEIRDRSIDGGIHNRAHILHYKVGDAAVSRIDPVALQPQDFVDEWLTQPWKFMESRSAETARDKLKLWHEFLTGDFVAGEFTLVQACSNKTSRWQVGINMSFINGKELPEPLPIYFLVEQPGQYQFKMTGIGFGRQDGCPGESQPSEDSPTLFPVHKNPVAIFSLESKPLAPLVH